MTFLGWLSDSCKGLNDLQLGDRKVTLNHLVVSKALLKPLFLTNVRQGGCWLTSQLTRSEICVQLFQLEEILAKDGNDPKPRADKWI